MRSKISDRKPAAYSLLRCVHSPSQINFFIGLVDKNNSSKNMIGVLHGGLYNYEFLLLA